MQPNPKLDSIHEETATPLSAKVSLSIHPESLLPHTALLEGDSPVAESVYKHGRAALKALYPALLDMEQAVEALTVQTTIGNSNSTGKPILRNQVPPERRPELHAALSNAFGRSTRVYEAHKASVDEAITMLETRVAAPLGDPKRNEAAAQHQASEIREILRQYPPEQRIPAIYGAIQDGDIDVVRAVLNTTPFAVGITPKDQAMIREMAGERFAPVESAHLKHAKQIAEKIQKASELYVGRFAKLIPDLKINPREQALAKLRGES